ncbi:alpha/beta fold hydrolase [Ruania suaedae]|uniref:alpha/beta fold hydrolase n=1 Tax=Ruania suaedae TaxID=2897774 RepID=UPI001E48446D|nr:alpha/beta fold hydrolase [Ruania suaedae]UFU03351.1 alpha/beta fold hydrolase [Ruania suaedae]
MATTDRPLTPGPRASSLSGQGRGTVDPSSDLSVAEFGDRDAPAVALLHGIGMSERYLRPLATELATDHHVIVPDLPGFGRSPQPDSPPSVEHAAQTLLRLLEARGIESATLVGHSMGAQVAVAMMTQAPQLARSAVLVGPVVDPAAASAARQAARLARSAVHEPAGVNAAALHDYLRAGPRWYSAVLPRMFAFDIRAATARVRGPVLVVRGQHDRVCPRPWARELAGAAPRGAWREVAGAAHAAMATHPGVVARWVRESGPAAVPDGQVR